MFGFGKKENQDKKVKIMVCTGNMPRHGYFVNRLAEHFDVVGVIAQATRPHLLSLIAEKHPLIRLHYTALLEKEIQYFGKDRKLNIRKSDQIIVSYGTLSGAQLEHYMQKYAPEYIVSFDASLIHADFIRTYTGHLLHLHNGLIDYYDGADANFWPLIDNRIECIGMTVHLIETAPDQGRMLGQIRPALDEKDSSEDAELKAILAGVHLTIMCIDAYSKGRLSTRERTESTPITHTFEDLTPNEILRVKNNITQGLMQTFIANRSHAHEKAPILEI